MSRRSRLSSLDRGIHRSLPLSLGLAFFAIASSLTVPRSLAQPIVPANDGTNTLVTPNGSRYDITGGTQAGSNLFQSFQRFGLDSNQIANFISRPDIANILSRVNGGDPSLINGLIQVTGGSSHLYLLNPAGILFGPNARLDVPGSFTATTANSIGFGNQEWGLGVGTPNYSQLVGNPSFFRFDAAQPGSLVNAGQLAVGPGQSLNLLGGTVVNTGTLTAPSGQITVMAVPGSSLVRLSQPGSLLSIEVQPLTNGNINTSLLAPLSLPQLLTGGGTFSNATGITVEADGSLRLAGSGIPATPGTTIVSGNLDVSGPLGGRVQVLGDRVGLLNATVNASGTNGGGTILVGGDYKGQGTVPNAQFTFVSPNSMLNANALQMGNGGKIIVWAEDSTDFYGTIQAIGGSLLGNGGFAEVSGKKVLNYFGRANLRAENGSVGNLLLDPTDFILSSANADSYRNDPHNVTISATNNIIIIDDFGADGLFFCAAPVCPGSIKFDAGNQFDMAASLILRTEGRNLTISAGGNISGGIIGTNGNTNENAGNLTLISTNGNITVNSIFARSERPDDPNTPELESGSGSGTGRGGNISISALNGTFTATGSLPDDFSQPTSLRSLGKAGSGLVDITAKIINIPVGNIGVFAGDPGEAFTPCNAVASCGLRLTASEQIIVAGINAEATILNSPQITINQGFQVTSNPTLYSFNTRNQSLTIQNSSTAGEAVISVPANANLVTANLILGANTNFQNTVTIEGSIQSNNSSALTFQGAATISSSIGDGGALSALTINGNASLGGSLVATTGSQTFGSSVTLGNNITFRGSSFTFGNALNSDSTTPRILTLEASGATGSINFNGPIGNINALANLTTPTDFSVQMGGGTITTTGNQAYNGSVTLVADTTLTGNNISFGSTINSGAAAARSLTINTTGSGTTSFSGPIGGTNPLNNLTLGTDGNTQINTTSIATSGNQVYNNAVTFLVASTLTTSSSLTFNNTLNAASDLTLRGSQIDFTGGLGSVTGSDNLTLEPATAGQNINIGGTLATTALDLTNATISALVNGFSSITIGRSDGTGTNTVTGPSIFQDPLLLRAPGTGGTTTLNSTLTGSDNSSITITSPRINANFGVTTAGQAITLNGNTIVGVNNLTFSTGNGTADLTLNGTIDSQVGTNFQLSLNAGGGNLRLNNTVGGTTPFLSLDTANPASIFMNGGAYVLNDLSFNAPIVLGGSSSIVSQNGNVNLQNAPITSQVAASNLTVNSAQGNIVTNNISTAFPGVGGNVSLTAPSGTVTGGDINTSGVTQGGSVFVQAAPFNTDPSSRVGLGSSPAISLGAINTSASIGNGGAVTLDPFSSVLVNSINAQGGANGFGGTVFIVTTNSLFTATGSFIDQNGLPASISTAGGLGGGNITIAHNGGDLFIPFNAGVDASIFSLFPSGTAGVLTTGADNVISNRVFPGRYTQPGGSGIIDLITSDRFSFALADAIRPGFEFTPLLDTPPELPFPLDAYFTRFYEEHFNRNLGERISVKSLTSIRRRLREVEEALKIKSALIYGFFKPDNITLEELMDSTQVEALKILASERYFDPSCFDLKESNKPGPKAKCKDEDVLVLVLVTGDHGPQPILVRGATRKVFKEILQTFNDSIQRSTSITRLIASNPNRVPNDQKLYQYILNTTLKKYLADYKITHLSFILDTTLRSLPLAALYNEQNEKYLIQEFPVSLMPSFSLTDPLPVNRLSGSQHLVMGADTFSGRDSLITIPTQMATILNIWQQPKRPDNFFLNQNFKIVNIQTRLPNLNIIYLGTHANFESDNIKPGFVLKLSPTEIRIGSQPETISAEEQKSFIQFWEDEKLYLRDFRQQLNLRKPLVDLMVLSACETSLGDQRAELGFTGMAAETGASTVVGSLWSVGELSTMALLMEFYLQLSTLQKPVTQNQGRIKLDALREAQLNLIDGKVRVENGQLILSNKQKIDLPTDLQQEVDKKFTTPYDWAAFTLLGSPW